MSVSIRMVIIMLAGFVATNARAADCYVAQAGQTSAVPYTSWATAASNIQTAVDTAAAGDTVWVGTGTYQTVAGTRVVSITKALSLRGSSDRENVIINGSGVRGGVGVSLGAPATVLVEGLTVTNCTSTTTGAGIGIGSSSSGTAVVHNCVITGNHSGTGAGGGIYASGASLYVEVSECLIQGNDSSKTEWSGGGGHFTNTRLLIRDSTITGNRLLDAANGRGGGLTFLNTLAGSIVRDCLFEDNVGVSTGGGIAAKNGPTFENCVIRNNRVVDTAGGGVAIEGGATLRNCLIYSNTVSGTFGLGGGVEILNNTSALIENCTVVSNRIGSSGAGGGIHIYGNCAGTTVRNTIFYYNFKANGTVNNIYKDSGTVEYSCAPGYTTLGNIADPPRFASLDTGDFRLTGTSPCRDAGLYQGWMDSSRDLDANPRIINGAVDMGCYEFRPMGTQVLIR